MDFAKKLLELQALSQSLCEQSNSVTTNLKLRLLFLIDKLIYATPAVLMSKLSLVKSNLALICKQLINEELIEAKKKSGDKRSIVYFITPNGKKVLEEALEAISKNFRDDEIDYYLLECSDKLITLLNKKI